MEKKEKEKKKKKKKILNFREFSRIFANFREYSRNSRKFAKMHEYSENYSWAGLYVWEREGTEILINTFCIPIIIITIINIFFICFETEIDN